MEDVDGGPQVKGALGEGGLFINSSFKHQKWIKMVMIHVTGTPPKTNMAPEIGHPKRKLVFNHPFSGAFAVSFREGIHAGSLRTIFFFVWAISESPKCHGTRSCNRCNTLLYYSKKSPIGPTEQTPNPENLMALAIYLGVRW